ncbi:exonuclease SbcCD subunit D C-terminal domain-containing protein [Herminiimonas sp. CN]|uniref:exonuclease SbcCD subunit D C-terminal domain-containing protein n=1 Tax=Herminiimonas sp. CN TaxID=1349818 RepID=UPI000473ABDE|nr:exonuclease SbcCD subunit D C-terminal domain-containing protein [Herminiimonas sp. CN]
MRFIHTSDWHLGQTLHNFERGFEHQHFLDWLLATLAAEQAEGLLISGDIFDNANPSAAAQKQLYRFLQQAKARVPHLNIVIIAGNHDSPGRLEAPGPLLETLDAAVIGFVPRRPDGAIDIAKLVVPLRNKLGGIAAWCLAVPFLRPGDVPRMETESDPYMEGIALLYRQALAHALTLRQPGQAIIALGHCHMVGGEISEDSERRIVIGGSEALSAGMFDPAIAYAALGHLHLAQSVGKQAHLRYCGSPLPLSFAEVGYPHQVLRVDLEGETVADITPLPVPRAVELLRVPQRPAPLEEVLTALAALELPANDEPQRQPYLEVRVRLDAPEPGLRARIEAALEGKPVRLAKIETSFSPKTANSSAPAAPEQLERLQPDDIFKRLYRSRYDADTPADLQAAFAELLLTPIDALLPSPACGRGERNVK